MKIYSDYDVNNINRNRLNQIFRKPPEPKKTLLWRYFTIDKFEWLLRESGLYLARVSRFPDPLEGNIPEPSAKHWKLFETRVMGTFDAKRFKEIGEDLRNNTFVNCWHINTNESIYMWKIYCGPDSGVVIEVRYSELDEACEKATNNRFFLGCVNYISDWTSFYINISNTFFRFMHKDGNFGKEQEARIVYAGLVNEDFVKMPINLELIEKIHIHPLATEDYYAKIKSSIEAYAPTLLSKLEWSSLRGYATKEDFQ